MRALLLGGGCRGRALTRALTADGHAVRAVTRTEAGRAAIEEVGGECFIGDPDVVGTLRYALENVTIVIYALGTATGGDVAALHGSRLQMFLEKVTDTTVRGVLYEAAGTVGDEAFASGRAELDRARERNEIPSTVLEADPADGEAWVTAALASIDDLLAVRRGPELGGQTL